eukprot:gene25944-31759_t
MSPKSVKMPSRSKKKQITIHVYDEARKTQKDFHCGLQELLSGMKYFRGYLSDVQNEEVEMSVHCDVKVFEWLLLYIQMETLVDECVTFIAKSINDVTRLPIDLSCLADPLLVKLARATTEDSLETVRKIPQVGGDTAEDAMASSQNSSARQLLVSKMYRLKLEEMLQ